MLKTKQKQKTSGLNLEKTGLLKSSVWWLFWIQVPWQLEQWNGCKVSFFLSLFEYAIKTVLNTFTFSTHYRTIKSKVCLPLESHPRARHTHLGRSQFARNTAQTGFYHCQPCIKANWSCFHKLFVHRRSVNLFTTCRPNLPDTEILPISLDGHKWLTVSDSLKTRG